MHKKLIILIVSLILISGCSAFDDKSPKTQKTITFTIPEESSKKTYVIYEKDKNIIGADRELKNKLNKWRYFNNFEEEEKQKLIDKKTRNWRRTINGKLIVGYDKDEDGLFYKFY